LFRSPQSDAENCCHDCPHDTQCRRAWAAPDLYDALAEIVRVLDARAGVDVAIAARAALAKARGEV
jgi:hypothetical protein